MGSVDNLYPESLEVSGGYTVSGPEKQRQFLVDHHGLKRFMNISNCSLKDVLFPLQPLVKRLRPVNLYVDCLGPSLDLEII